MKVIVKIINSKALIKMKWLDQDSQNQKIITKTVSMMSKLTTAKRIKVKAQN